MRTVSSRGILTAMEMITGRERLLVTRHRNHAAVDPRALRRAVRSGEMLRLHSGAYVRSAVWAGLTEPERRRLEIAAALDASSTGRVVGYRSAAAIWDVPTLGRPDGTVHVRTTVAAGTRTEHGFRKHAVADPDLHVVQHRGVLVTSLPRTLVDLALTESFASAVVAVDHALRKGIRKDELRAVLNEVGPKQGRARVEHVIEFGDGRSGSVGESWSRAEMDLSGLVMPTLQEEFVDERGLIGFVDFWWPRIGLIGEFDGIGKFTDPAMLAGRSTRQALADEKRREDRLRNCRRRPAVTRWLWEVLEHPGTLTAQLLTAGVPRR